MAYEVNARGAYLTRVLDNGHIVDVVPLTFGRARLLLSRDSTTVFAENVW